MLKFLGGLFGAAGSIVVTVFILSLSTISIRSSPGDLSEPTAIGLGVAYVGVLAAAARAAKRSARFRPVGVGIWVGIGAALLFEGLCFASMMRK